MAVETKEVLADVRAGKYEPWTCLDTYIVAHLAELLTKLRDKKAYRIPRSSKILINGKWFLATLLETWNPMILTTQWPTVRR